MKVFFKKTIAVILILFFILTLSACSSKSNNTVQPSNNSNKGDASGETDDSWERIKKNGKITIGIDDAFPPLEFRDEKNNLVGYDIDLAAEAAKRMGIQVEWIPTDWNGVILALNSGKFDIIWSGMSMTKERAQQVDFSPAYLNESQVIVVRGDEESIKKKDDLKGKVVGTQLGSTSEEAAKTLEGIKELKKYSKFTEAFLDLANKRVDAIVVDELVGRYYMTKRPGQFKVLFPLVKEPVGIAFRKQDKALREAITKVLKEMKEDGTMAKISQKWFGEDISVFEEIKFE